MLAIRSFIFLFLLFGAALVLSAAELLAFWAPFRIKWAIAVAWADFSLWAGRVFCGLDVSTEGAENIPDEPCIFLIKHTTALEVYWQISALPPATWVLKRELLYIPVFGWALGLVMKSIAIDRKAGGPAVKQVIDQGRQRLASGLSVSIFPEGTRTPDAAGRNPPLRHQWRGSGRRFRLQGCARGPQCRRLLAEAPVAKVSRQDTVLHRPANRRHAAVTEGNEFDRAGLDRNQDARDKFTLRRRGERLSLYSLHSIATITSLRRRNHGFIGLS